MTRQIGIREIAEKSGYSIATVSRVLNGKGKYSAAAAEAIRKAAEENGYEPDVYAKGLRSMRSRYIGLIIPDLKVDFYTIIALMVQNALAVRGYYPIFLNIGPDGIMTEQGMAILRSVNVSGLISVSNVIGAEILERLGVPVVYINRDFAGIDFHGEVRYSSIQSNYRQGGVLAAEELFRKGCRTVGFLCGNHTETKFAVRKRESFLETAEEYGMRVLRTEIFPEVTEPMSGYLGARELFSRERADGLFCATDWTQVGALLYFREAGIRIPDDVQTVGFGKVSDYPNLYMPLTSVRIPAPEIAKEAASMIIDLVENEEAQPKEILLPVSLVQGDTTKHSL